MTDIDIQALRDFMATEVMGWYLQEGMIKIPTGKECSGYFAKSGLQFYKEDWLPDIDSNQLDMLIDKMVEDGWYLNLFSGRDEFIGGQLTNYAEFSKKKKSQRLSPFEYESHDYYWNRHPDRRLAVLLAIKAAKES